MSLVPVGFLLYLLHIQQPDEFPQIPASKTTDSTTKINVAFYLLLLLLFMFENTTTIKLVVFQTTSTTADHLV